MLIVNGVSHSDEEVRSCVPLGFSGQDDDIVIRPVKEGDIYATNNGHRYLHGDLTGARSLYDVLYNEDTGLCCVVEDTILTTRKGDELIEDPDAELPPCLRGLWCVSHNEEWYNSPEELANAYDREWLEQLIGYIPEGSNRDRTVFVQDDSPAADFAIRCLCG